MRWWCYWVSSTGRMRCRGSVSRSQKHWGLFDRFSLIFHFLWTPYSPWYQSGTAIGGQRVDRLKRAAGWVEELCEVRLEKLICEIWTVAVGHMGLGLCTSWHAISQRLSPSQFSVCSALFRVQMYTILCILVRYRSKSLPSWMSRLINQWSTVIDVPPVKMGAWGGCFEMIDCIIGVESEYGLFADIVADINRICRWSERDDDAPGRLGFRWMPL